MAAVGSGILTLADHAKRTDSTGKVQKIVEVLEQTNEMISDAHFVECNKTASHETTIRTGLPDVYWRKINSGTQPSKSTTAQVEEGCAMMEAWSEVDEDLANLGGDLAALRASEAKPFLEAMSQEAQSTLLYGNSASAPEEFTGLSTRYSSLSAANGQNIVSGGGAGSDNTSIWLISWGEDTVHGIFPKGSKAGLQHKDHGLCVVETVAGVAGSRMSAYRDQFKWHMGLALRDWRYAVRIANIDVSNLVAKSSAADLIDLMIKAMHRIPNLSKGRTAFYANRTVRQMLDIQKRDDVVTGGGLTYENVDGKPVMSFRGIPLRLCDSILETEAAVS